MFSIGGADSYGYVNQAYDWASGQLPRPIPDTHAAVPGSDVMQIPLGYRTARPHTMVPIYAPGLPLIMAVSLLAGRRGPFFVVPIVGVLYVVHVSARRSRRRSGDGASRGAGRARVADGSVSGAVADE